MESHQGTEETEQLPTGGTGGRDARHDRENCSFKGQGGFLNWDCRKPGAKDNERVRGKGQGSGLGVLGFGGGLGDFVLCCVLPAVMALDSTGRSLSGISISKEAAHLESLPSMSQGADVG